jgi:hypothetical protein
MRLNDVGVQDIIDYIKNNWGYLFLGDSGTTYDGSSVTDKLGYLTLDSMTSDTNLITLTFRLNTLLLNGEDISKSFLATSSSSDIVDSKEYFTEFTKDNLTEWRWVYTIKLIR